MLIHQINLHKKYQASFVNSTREIDVSYIVVNVLESQTQNKKIEFFVFFIVIGTLS